MFVSVGSSCFGSWYPRVIKILNFQGTIFCFHLLSLWCNLFPNLHETIWCTSSSKRCEAQVSLYRIFTSGFNLTSQVKRQNRSILLIFEYYYISIQSSRQSKFHFFFNSDDDTRMLARVVRCDYSQLRKGKCVPRVAYLLSPAQKPPLFLLVWFRSSPGSWVLAACELDCSMMGGIVREFVR